MTYAPDKFSVCTPVWQVGAKNFAETAAFNAELYDGPSSRPLVMNAGDTIRIHFFVASAAEGWHVQITDLTTGHSGTVVLNSKYGPLLPAFSQQKIGNALGWGLVNDTPNSFVWEIGHTSPFTSPPPSTAYPGRASATPTMPPTGSASARCRSSQSRSPTGQPRASGPR